MMKRIIIVLMITFTAAAIFAEKPAQTGGWQQGEYVEYILTSYDSLNRRVWTACKYIVMNKLESGLWKVQMQVKGADFEYHFIFEAAEPHSGGAAYIPVNLAARIPAKRIRGAEADRNRVDGFVSMFTEMLNADKLRLDSEKVSATGAVDKPDISYPWIDKDYTIIEQNSGDKKYRKYYAFNDSIPLFHLAGIETSDKRSSLRIVAYGLNTPDFSSYDGSPAFIDFKNIESVRFDDFSIRYPATWSLAEQKPESRDEKRFFAVTGGNIHSATLTVEINNNADSVFIDKELKNYDQDIDLGGILFKKVGNNGRDDSEHYEKYFYYAVNNGVIKGFVISGVYVSKVSRRYSAVSLFVSFSDDNPLIDNIEAYFNDSRTIVESFRFENQAK